MKRYEACLIDVYDTALHCDFAVADQAMRTQAGIEPQVWQDARRDLGALVMDGRMSLYDVFAEALRRSGVDPDDEHLRDLVRRDGERLHAASTVYDDTVPFLQALRRKGVRTAIVSNCAENTGPLLTQLGLSDLVDATVLSCEVGCAKPDPQIYKDTLARIGAAADTALFIDDQATYCDGATALGIDAIHIRRNGDSDGSDETDDERQTVTSLAGLDALF